jgi:hypothetical protein
MQWLRQVHRDEALPYTAFYTCFYLCEHCLVGPNQYFEIPQGDIAAGGKIHTRTVRELTKTLMSRGHIRFEYRPGRGKMKRYWLVLKG